MNSRNMTQVRGKELEERNTSSRRRIRGTKTTGIRGTQPKFYIDGIKGTLVREKRDKPNTIARRNNRETPVQEKDLQIGGR